MEWVATGVKVHYITGNHDEMLRIFVGFKLRFFSIENSIVPNLHGKKVWMFLGDVLRHYETFQNAMTLIKKKVLQ